ncbi:hypothetical protein MtrunA17_Chr8g0391131 [Medicago truncatula]|uniref:Transmembrane protein n=1 Tax=Medicago truncatula TaxID=3880 RepID=A0A396GTL3_MEDTR|nr:hypothetical protein MtrunA17_Chr8g0391131 [Medicago truncatula]
MISWPSSFILLIRSICSVSNWAIYPSCVSSRVSNSLKVVDSSSRFPSSIKYRTFFVISFI